MGAQQLENAEKEQGSAAAVKTEEETKKLVMGQSIRDEAMKSLKKKFPVPGQSFQQEFILQD